MIGLETEYGLCRDEQGLIADAGQFFESLRYWYSKRTPIAGAFRDDKRFFIANGGCIGLEPSPSGDPNTGILETATPECRSPMQLVTYQTVHDEWLAECLNDLYPERSMAWVKNSGDAYDHIYGQHENYELEIARGWRLWLWRLGLLLLLPQLLLYRVACWLWLGTIAIIDRVLKKLAELRPRPPAQDTFDEWIGEKPPEWQAKTRPTLAPSRVRLAALGLRYLHWPIALTLNALIQALVLVPHRRWAAGFFASRSVMEGSGHLDRDGRFWLSARAASTTTVIGFGRYWNEHPIFGTGHWLRSLLLCQSPTFESWRQLFRRRQRVQITLGDATPNPRAQFLRIGATCLIFDLIESRRIEGLPRIDHCISSLKAYATDPTMTRTVADRSRESWNAIELQRLYAAAVRRYVSQAAQSSIEAWEIIDQWQMTLDHLRESEQDTDCQRWLLGRVDWVSKRWLMDQTQSRPQWSARKKIDLKYHELSSQGYYRMLVKSLDLSPFITGDEIRRSMRLPPLDTPAMQRGYWIREFSCEHTKLQVDWTIVRWANERGKMRRSSLT